VGNSNISPKHMTASTLPVDDPLAIEQDTLRLLYANSTIGLVASLVLATVVAITHWPVIAHSVLLAWWSAMALLTAIRAISIIRFRISIIETSLASPWFAWHVAGTALSGIAWGAGGILLFAQDSFEHQAFLSLTLAGMVAGAAHIHAASRATFLVFALPACLPIIAKLFLIGDRLHVTIGTVGLLFVGVMTGLVWSLNRGLVRIFELNAARQQAEEQVRALNQNLERLVTERTGELHESEQLFRTLAEVAPVGIFRTDPSGHCLYVNARWCDITGMGIETAVTNGWTAALHPDDRERVAEEWTQAVRSHRPFLSEYRFQSAEQKITWVVGQAQAELDHQGIMVGYVGTITDITERKRAEDALRASEDLYRVLYDETPTMYFKLATDGTVRSVNQFGAAQLGYQVEELVGHSVLGLFHEADREAVAAKLAECLATPEQTGRWEFRKVRKDGQTIWVHETVRVGGSSTGETVLLVSCEDITDHKRAEDRLRTTQYAVDHATDFIFVIGSDGYFLDVNESACRRLGYTKQELLTKSVMDIDPDLPPDVWVSFWNEFKQKKLLRLETRHRSKSGKIYPVEVVANYILHEGKELDYAFVRDITERKQAEETLLAFQEQIRQMQKMEAIGQLAGGVAHDFNNILTAILGNAELAYSTIASDHPSRANLTMVLDAGNRASRLVQQILTFSHRQELSRTVIALIPVVDEVLAMLRATLPAGVELTHSCDPATPPILADATEIHQVVMNLCTNAWHALEGKQGLIAVDLAPMTLTQPLKNPYASLLPGSYACLSVRDTGCGMDSDTVTRIFDPFFTTKPVGQGTGLGLSVALGIVQGHDGAIVVNSHPGQGTTFSLYFPAAEALAQTSLPLETAPVQIQKQGCRLLYLDDERMLVDLVRAKLEPHGYRITGCTTAAEALAAVSADPAGFDVVVTDYNMPGMSGLEVARALIQIRADLPVVLVSGYLSSETHMATLAAGVKEIVYKPNMLRQLEDVVARIIDRPPHSSTSARHETDPQ